MNAVAIRTAGRYLGAWGAIVLCVVLLSLLFTFLGTITCAVLAGMMMGAFKGAKCFSVSVSLVFPAVIFGMARGAKVELSPHQITLLAVLCFGTFWVTYVVSAFVFFHEQKGKKPARRQVSELPPEASAQSGPVAATDHAPAELCLGQLQGSWVCEPSSPGEALCKKVLQIKDARLELRAIDASGHITLLAAGDVTLQRMQASHALVVPSATSKPADSQRV